MNLQELCVVLGGDREIIVTPTVRKIDKNGRAYFGREYANIECVMIGVSLKEGDKGIREIGP